MHLCTLHDILVMHIAAVILLHIFSVAIAAHTLMIHVCYSISLFPLSIHHRTKPGIDLVTIIISVYFIVFERHPDVIISQGYVAWRAIFGEFLALGTPPGGIFRLEVWSFVVLPVSVIVIMVVVVVVVGLPVVVLRR
jgi:hypothetical protein